MQFSRHALKIRKTLGAFNLRRVGVDRKNLVTRVSQFAKDWVSCASTPTGHASYSDSPALKEIPDQLNCIRHLCLHGPSNGGAKVPPRSKARRVATFSLSPSSNVGYNGSRSFGGLPCHSVTIARTQVRTGFMTSAGMRRVA